jgi:hypothetical protein
VFSWGLGTPLGALTSRERTCTRTSPTSLLNHLVHPLLIESFLVVPKTQHNQGPMVWEISKVTKQTNYLPQL